MLAKQYTYIKSVGIAFLLRLFSALASFVLTVVAARLLDAKHSGVFFLFMSLLSLLSVVSRLGLGPVTTRFLANFSQEGDWKAINSLLGKVLLIVFFASIFFSAAIFLCADIIAINLFDEELLLDPLRYGAVTLVPFSCLWILAHANQGLHNINKMLFYHNLGITTLTILLVAIFLFFSSLGQFQITVDLNLTVLYYCAACFIVFFVAFIDWYKLKPMSRFTSGYSARTLLSLGAPLYVTGILAVFLQTANQQLLGVLHGSEQIAIYTITYRVAALMALTLTSISAISAPRFAASHAKGDVEGLRYEAARMSLLLLLISVPLLLFILSFPEKVLLIFGREYIEYTNVLRALAIGQFIVMIAGSVGSILMMSGNSKYNARSNLVALFFLLASGWVLIPEYGAFGASLGFVFAVFSQMLLNVIVVKLKFGFIPLLEALKLVVHFRKGGVVR